MPWVLAAAAVTVGGSLLAGNNASNAAQSAADQQSAAAAAAQAENARQFDTIQANNAPYRAVGSSAIGALGGAFGLPGYGAPTMTGSTATGTGTATGAGMTGGMSDAEKAQMDAYLQANPDVAAWAASGHGDPSLGTNQTPEQAAAYQYRNTGQAEGRTLPPLSMTGSTTPSAAGGYVAPPGYTDPTAPNGYNVGPRPATAPIPGQYQAPALNVGLDAYQQSPGYAFQLQQGQNALDHTASSMGGVMSGARVKAYL